MTIEALRQVTRNALQICITPKDQKKLLKGYQDLTFDDENSCVLPEDADEILLNIILEMKSVDVMKYAITKLHNPLKGRDVFGRGSGGR